MRVAERRKSKFSLILSNELDHDFYDRRGGAARVGESPEHTGTLSQYRFWSVLQASKRYVAGGENAHYARQIARLQSDDTANHCGVEHKKTESTHH